MKCINFKPLLTAIALISVLTVSAQKKNVLVKPTESDNVSANDIEKVHARIIEGLSNLPTINLLDSSNDGAEADYIFQCTIDSISFYPLKQTDGSNKYNAEVWMSTSVSDAETNKVEFEQKVVAYSSLVLTSYSDEKQAALSALSWIPEKIERNVWKAFAVKGQILSIEEVKKEKAAVVSVSVGEQNGAAKKQSFDVYLPDSKLIDENGIQKPNKPIGKVKVEDLGDEISVCKVDKGGEEIYKAFQEDPTQLTVYSKGPSKGLIGDGKWWAQVGAEYIWECNKAKWVLEGIWDSAKSIGKSTKDAGKEVIDCF